MGDTKRTDQDTVKLLSELGEAPFRFGFFNAVRLLECAHSDRARLGQAMRAADEPARLGQEPSLAFAPASLASFKPGRHASPPWLNVHFLGLLGPNGPLPLHLTEYARDRSRHHRDPTFGRFLNIFNNRLLALFYRAWANGEPTVSLDRPDSDRFAVYVGALCGFGIPALRERDALPDRARFYYCGRISNQARNPEGLAAVVGDYFDMPAQVLEFVGDWLAVPQDCRWRLGTQGAGGRLGVRTTLGERTWDCQHKFRLQLPTIVVFCPVRGACAGCRRWCEATSATNSTGTWGCGCGPTRCRRGVSMARHNWAGAPGSRVARTTAMHSTRCCGHERRGRGAAGAPGHRLSGGVRPWVKSAESTCSAS